MHAHQCNVHCTELKTVFLIETVRKFICLENFQCTVLLIETKRKICNSTFNRTVCLIESTEYVQGIGMEKGEDLKPKAGPIKTRIMMTRAH